MILMPMTTLSRPVCKFRTAETTASKRVSKQPKQQKRPKGRHDAGRYDAGKEVQCQKSARHIFEFLRRKVKICHVGIVQKVKNAKKSARLLLYSINTLVSQRDTCDAGKEVRCLKSTSKSYSSTCTNAANDLVAKEDGKAKSDGRENKDNGSVDKSASDPELV